MPRNKENDRDRGDTKQKEEARDNNKIKCGENGQKK